MSEARAVNLSLTHTGSDKLSKSDISTELAQIKNRLELEFNHSPDELKHLLQMLDALSDFELGRFLIKNKSLSGYWTWYVISGFRHYQITSPLEKYFIDRSPVILATRERFEIFQSLLATHIKPDSVVCSLPCGMMADLLTLNLDEKMNNVRFVGIDLDSTALDLAKDLAKQLNIQNPCEFLQKNAWDLNIKNEFDLLTTSGLNIYEKDDSKVVSLYRSMHQALKDQGYLICSALTPPPNMTASCEWNMDNIDENDLELAVVISRVILQAIWSNFRSSEKTCEQLREAGFDKIEIYWDKQKMFPTFLAQK